MRDGRDRQFLVLFVFNGVECTTFVGAPDRRKARGAFLGVWRGAKVLDVLPGGVAQDMICEEVVERRRFGAGMYA